MSRCPTCQMMQLGFGFLFLIPQFLWWDKIREVCFLWPGLLQSAAATRCLLLFLFFVSAFIFECLYAVRLRSTQDSNEKLYHSCARGIFLYYLQFEMKFLQFVMLNLYKSGIIFDIACFFMFSRQCTCRKSHVLVHT